MRYAKAICVYLEYDYEVNEAFEIITDSLQDKYISFEAEIVSQITDYIKD